MLAHPDTPGVYIHPLDAGRGNVGPARTDISGFAGIAERGPVGVAVPIASMRQFESVFGSYSGVAYLAYAVRAFFENGGQQCRVCRVAGDGRAAAEVRLRLADGRFGLRLSASSPGSWGNGLNVRLAPARRAETIARAGDSRVSKVASTHGLDRLALVRISQDAVELWRIVAAVDPAAGKIHWVHPDPSQRALWQQPLSGLDLGRPFRVERVDYDLTEFERGRLSGVYQALSPVEGAQRQFDAVLRLPSSLCAKPGPDARASLGETPPGVIASLEDGLGADWAAVPIADPFGQTFTLAGGIDGLTLLSPDDYLALGLAPLEARGEVAILACPDINIQPVWIARDPLLSVIPDPCAPCALEQVVASAPPMPVGELPPIFSVEQVYRVQAAMVDQCERLRDRVALIDAPWTTASGNAIGPGPVRQWRSRFESAFGVLCHPWLQTPDPLRRGRTRAIPPSGHIAGQYAASDLAAGFPRAAAHVPLAWALAATLAVNPSVHGLLNSEGINVIAAREGRSLRNLGARTMASDPSWRFVPVRRLVSMLRDALEVATQWAVFEPNDDTTRTLLRHGIAGFLDELWRQGALAGTTADQAYRVRCDEVNNPSEARARGELRVDIAIAPSSPLEFIVLRIGRQANSFALSEDTVPTSTYLGGAM